MQARVRQLEEFLRDGKSARLKSGSCCTQELALLRTVRSVAAKAKHWLVAILKSEDHGQKRFSRAVNGLQRGLECCRRDDARGRPIRKRLLGHGCG